MRLSLIATALVWAFFAQSAPLQAQQASNPLPPGEGHDIIAVACTQCHGAKVFTQLREGADAWRDQIYYMILRGAQVRPSEMDRAVNYLVANFGPGVNIPAPLTPVALPDGPGKDLVATNCALCHGLDRIAETKRSPQEWEGTVSRMIYFGAPLSAEQANAVNAYLDARFAAK